LVGHAVNDAANLQQKMEIKMMEPLVG
jgi:hypothetical protein